MSIQNEIEAEQLDPNNSGRISKYLTFMVGDESFGLPVLRVREIIRLVNITAVPNTPEYVKGVVNLRGKIIPIIDLRLKFEMGEGDVNKRTCVIVVQLELEDGETTLMGLVVDGVDEVVGINLDEVEKMPDFGTSLNTDCITGVIKIKGDVKTLLDIDRAVGLDALAHGVAA